MSNLRNKLEASALLFKVEDAIRAVSLIPSVDEIVMDRQLEALRALIAIHNSITASGEKR